MILHHRTITKQEILCDTLIVAIIVLVFAYFTPHLYFTGVTHYNKFVGKKDRIEISVEFEECVEKKNNNMRKLKKLINLKSTRPSED